MKEDIKQLTRNRVTYLENNKDHLTIDGDTHPSDLNSMESSSRLRYESTPNYYQGRPISAEQLVNEMDLANVDACICWHNPSSLIYEQVEYINHDGFSEANEINFQKLHASNKYIFESSLKYPERILPAGWTDPKALGVKMAKEMARICIQDFGFLVVKMNPAQNEYYMDDPAVIQLVDHIVSLGGIPAFHFGGDTPYTPASAMEKIASHLGDHPVIGVHMGGGGSHYVHGDALCTEARNLGLRHTNIFYVLSAIRDCHIESNLVTYQLAGEPYCHRIACGSDAPYGKMTWNFGGFRAMSNALVHAKKHTDPRLGVHEHLFDEHSIQNFLGRNMANFLVEGYKKLLKVQEHKFTH